MENEVDKVSPIGRKIEGLRRVLNVSQETLASRLNMSRQQLVRLEKNGNIDDKLLQDIASVLGVNADTIRNFNEDAVINCIQNNYDNTQSPSQYVFEYHYHASDKELVEKNELLYKQLLQSEKEKVALLQSLLNKAQ